MKERLNEINAHSQNEEKLRGYLSLLDTLINTIPNPIYFKDESGIYRGCNKAFAKRIMGISRAEIIGRRSQDLTDQIPAELSALYQLNERKMLQKDGVQNFEAEVPCSGGIRREFLFNIAAIKNGDGQSMGSVSIMLDLTEQNRRVQKRLGKEKSQAIIETTSVTRQER